MDLTQAVAALAVAVVLLNASCHALSTDSRSIEDAKEARAQYEQGKACLGNVLDAPPGKREYRQAISSFSRAIHLKPDFAAAYGARGYSYYLASRSDLAIEDYGMAIRLEPNNARIYYLRGWAYAYENKLNMAIDDYTRTIGLEPNHAGAYYNRGLAHKHLGDEPRAQTDMAKGRELGFQD